MPWLIGTAFLHSIMVQEKRGMLKVWNACLIVATFSLALLGTFLVRSGVLQSIHAFGDSTVGPYILGLIAVVADRLDGADRLPPRRPALERADRLAALARVGLPGQQPAAGRRSALVIFWGTFFPLISELFTGDKASLAAPWFDRYTTPLAILLVLFTGIGPLLAWRRVSWASAKRRLRSGPAIAAGGDDRRPAALSATPGHQPWALVRSSPSPPSPWPGSRRSSGAARPARRALTGGSMPARAGRRSSPATGAATAATSSTPASPCC